MKYAYALELFIGSLCCEGILWGTFLVCKVSVKLVGCGKRIVVD